jgi:hypothetical protein
MKKDLIFGTSFKPFLETLLHEQRGHEKLCFKKRILGMD